MSIIDYLLKGDDSDRKTSLPLWSI